MKRIAIWGGADLGRLVVKQIRAYFKEWEIVSLMDKNPDLQGVKILEYFVASPEEALSNEKEADILIICSSNYYKEIGAEAIEKYKFPEDRILFVKTSWPTGLQMHPAIRQENIHFMPLSKNLEYIKSVIAELKTSEGVLNSIGIKYGTDKASIMIVESGIRLTHDYLRHYDRLLQNIRHERKTICELGCGNGASLKMWKEYFTQAQIIGVDINTKAKAFEEERVEVICGNSTDDTTISELRKRGKFYLIIDDASHAWGDMRVSFEKLWDLLESGGIYILEDCFCGAQGSFAQYPPIVYDSQSIFDYVLSRAKIMNFCKDWNPEYNHYHFNLLPEKVKQIERELDSITIIYGACIIHKR